MCGNVARKGSGRLTQSWMLIGAEPQDASGNMEVELSLPVRKLSPREVNTPSFCSGRKYSERKEKN